MTRHDRYFNTGDEVVDAALRTLDHLSGNDACGGEIGLFDTHIHATIGAYKMLPSAVSRHVRVNPYVGDYFALSDARRAAIWTEITAGLNEGLDSILADETLQKGGCGDLSGRPTSIGERIIAACDSLMAAIDRGGPNEAALAALLDASSGTPARGDADKLKRLLQMKRIPDHDTWRLDVVRAISHAKDIGQNQHHRPAD